MVKKYTGPRTDLLGVQPRRSPMLTKTRIVIAAALVLASASASLAATAGRSAPGAPGLSNGATGFAPGSRAEQEWFERASRPSNL
jgi:hypothetical protein